MKRNDIHKELEKIMQMLQFNLGAMPACARLSKLMEAIDEDPFDSRISEIILSV